MIKELLQYDTIR